MALTSQELEQARTLRLQGKSTDEVFNYIAGKRVNAPSRLSTVRKEPLSQSSTGASIISDIPQDIFTGVKQLGEGYQDRFTRLKESGTALARGEQGIAETGVQFASNIAGGAIADPAYQLLRTGASFATTPEQETKIAEKVGETVQSVGEKTGITNWYSGLDDRTKRNVNAALDIADVLPVGIFGKVKSAFKSRQAIDATPKIEDAIIRAEAGDTSDAVRIANTTLDETTRATEVQKLGQAYQDSLVGDRVKVNRLLQEQAQDMSRGDVVVTQDDLVQALANEGVIPDIRGKLADFTTEIRNLDKRQNELFKAYQPVLEASKATASIDDFASYAKRSIADSRNLGFELNKAEAQLDTVVENLRRKYGDNLSAKQIDEISREANARSKAYREGGNTFEADIYSELGRGARAWLNDNIPDNAFREVNDEWLRLEQVKRTAETMQNQQIDVGLLGRALGSYVTTLTGVTLASGVANPFVGVAAGILTKMGGDAIADMMRSTRFAPEIRAKLQERLTTDKALIEKLKQTSTTEEAKNLYDQLSRMLPAPKEGALRSEVGSGKPIVAGGGTPDGVVTPGITERTVEGAVRQPEVGNPTPLPRGLYPSLSDAEISQLNTDTFRKTLENAGVDVETAKKAIIGGVGAYLLMAYLGEDGTIAPAGMAILAASPKSVRAQLIKEVKDIAKKTGKKIDESDLDKKFRRQEEELWKERGMETRGDGTLKDAKKNNSSALVEEARNYKSVEEFVKAQGTPVYHGTGVKFDNFDDSMRGSLTGAKSAKGAIWFTDDNATAKAYSIYSAEEAVVKKALAEADALEKIAQKSGKNADWEKYDAKIAEMEDLAKYDNTFNRRGQANVKEVIIDGDLYEVDAKGKSPQELSSGENIDSWLDEQLQEAKRLGKDGVKITNLDDAVGLYNRPATHYAIFDSEKIKTKSQLTDIWKEANKK